MEKDNVYIEPDGFKGIPGIYYPIVDRDAYNEIVSLKLFSDVAGRTLIADLTPALAILNMYPDKEFENTLTLLSQSKEAIKALQNLCWAIEAHDYLRPRNPKDALIFHELEIAKSVIQKAIPNT